jgi:RHS repeat-associated protein
MKASAVRRVELRFGQSHYTGKERDSESGNDYFGARYYASTMGRFLSPDWSAKEDPVPYVVLDDPQSLNLYAYVRNNPLARTDPDGHCTGVISCTLEIGVLAITAPEAATVALGGAIAAGLGAGAYDVAHGYSPSAAPGGYPTSFNLNPTSENAKPTPAEAPAGDPHAPGDEPNGQVVVRGGQGAPPSSGTYSGAQGATEEEAGKGVPHGTVSTTTGGGIRAAGGDVRPAPEPAHPGGPINGQHVNVTGGQSAFGPPHPNPAPKPQRIPSAPKPPNQ